MYECMYECMYESVYECMYMSIVTQVLYGHTNSVVCLATSKTYRVVVSGSADATCILWDLNKMTFIRQLCPHSGPITALAISDLTVRWMYTRTVHMHTHNCTCTVCTYVHMHRLQDDLQYVCHLCHLQR